MTQQENVQYNIPLRFRKMENLHIVFWLLKDIGWCLVWKPLGIAMVFPTLVIAIVIAIRTRNMVSELCHNLAIVLWISANSYWMIAEFFHFDEKPVIGPIHFKQLALVPFLLGIFILAYYYMWWKPRNKTDMDTM